MCNEYRTVNEELFCTNYSSGTFLVLFYNRQVWSVIIKRCFKLYILTRKITIIILNITDYLAFRVSNTTSLVNKNPTNKTKNIKPKMLYCCERADAILEWPKN